MRLLRWLTVALAVSGTAALVLASRSTARPLTLIASVSPAMNFAYVRVEGAVLAYPTLAREGDYLSFHVQDASGDIRVSAYRAVCAQLLTAGRIPMPGDVVAVEGTLRVRDDEPSLVLNMADGLSASRSEPRAIALAALDATPLGQRVTVAGQVREVRDVAGALRIVGLRQGNAQADLVFPLELTPVAGAPPSLAPGDWITATGGVGVYRDKRQILPTHAGMVVKHTGGDDPAARLDVRPIGALDRNLVGAWVAVRGQVAGVNRIQQGAILELQDGDDRISVAVFDAWAGVPFSETLQAGDWVIAQGEVAEYKRQLEIMPELPIDLIASTE